jgi:hypothetical protein
LCLGDGRNRTHTVGSKLDRAPLEALPEQAARKGGGRERRHGDRLSRTGPGPGQARGPEQATPRCGEVLLAGGGRGGLLVKESGGWGGGGDLGGGDAVEQARGHEGVEPARHRQGRVRLPPQRAAPRCVGAREGRREALRAAGLGPSMRGARPAVRVRVWAGHLPVSPAIQSLLPAAALRGRAASRAAGGFVLLLMAGLRSPAWPLRCRAGSASVLWVASVSLPPVGRVFSRCNCAQHAICLFGENLLRRFPKGPLVYLRDVVQAGFVQLGLANSEEIAEESWVAGNEVGQLVDGNLQHLHLLLGDEIREVVQAAQQTLLKL